jgi:DNA-binding LacI/PurR family transcriptional regulator
MARIKDIAAKVGISSTSVSKYLRDPDTKHVSPELKVKIDSAVEELQYRKHVTSRNRSSGKKTISILIPYNAPFSRSGFLNELLSGLESVFLNNGCCMTFLPTHGENSVAIIKNQLESHCGADGFIFFNTRYCSADDLENNITELSRASHPFVVLNSPALPQEINQVVFTTPVSSSAVKFLLAQGHQRIVLMLGRMQSATSCEELKHYRDYYEQAGLAVDEDLILYGDYEWPIAKGAMFQFLQKGIDFSAAYCITDTMALGVYEALKEYGLRIPEDISVIGKNDSFFANFLNPPLTTVRLKIFEAGVKAAEILLDAIQHGSEPKKVFLDTELILRSSTTVHR